MKKIMALFTASLLVCSYLHAEYNHCGSCDDENEFYVNLFGGANFIQSSMSSGVRNNYKTGYIVSSSLGYSWCYGLRLEGEYAYRRNSLKSIHFFGRTFSISGHFQSSSYMANVLWDLPLRRWGCDFWKIRPFVGGGIGYDDQLIHANNSGFSYREGKKGFAWQVMAGLKYPIFCHTHISLEYKFHKGGLNNVYNHSVGAGLTYYFSPNFGS